VISTTLNVRRFKQLSGECAIAAAASVANFYNPEIEYDYVSNLVANDGNGMYTPDTGTLLNRLGFQSVTIVTANIELLDFYWKSLRKDKLIEQLRKTIKYHKDHRNKDSREEAASYIKFLNRQPGNKVLIDRHFGHHIRESLDNGNPVLVDFNWNLFFEYPKWSDMRDVDPIKGDSEEHEVVINGYDKNGVHIVDSHHELYNGRLSKFRNGYYTMTWEELMTVMGSGDLLIPHNYSQETMEKYELV
jgi:hypothetical protein